MITVSRRKMASAVQREDHKKKISSSIENISSLLANLQVSEDDDHAEMEILHASVGLLMNTVNDRQLDLIGDLSSIVQSLKAGLMTPEDLERVIRTEQDRSQFILNLSSMIGKHMGQLFSMMGEMLEHSARGEPMPEASVIQMNSQMTLVSETVDSISRVIQAPAHKLQLTIDEVESDIASAVKGATDAIENGLSSKANSTTKPKGKNSKSTFTPSPVKEPISPEPLRAVTPDLSQSRKSPGKFMSPSGDNSYGVRKVDFGCQADLMPTAYNFDNSLLTSSHSQEVPTTASTTTGGSAQSKAAKKPGNNNAVTKGSKAKSKTNKPTDNAATIPSSHVAAANSLLSTVQSNNNETVTGPSKDFVSPHGGLSASDAVTPTNTNTRSVNNDSAAATALPLTSNDAAIRPPLGGQSSSMTKNSNFQTILSNDLSVASENQDSVNESIASGGEMDRQESQEERSSNSLLVPDGDEKFPSKLDVALLESMAPDAKVDYLLRFIRELERELHQRSDLPISQNDDISGLKSAPVTARGVMKRGQPRGGILHSSGSPVRPAVNGDDGFSDGEAKSEVGETESNWKSVINSRVGSPGGEEEGPKGSLTRGNSKRGTASNSLEIGGDSFKALSVLHHSKYHPGSSHVQTTTVIPRIPNPLAPKMSLKEKALAKMGSKRGIALNDDYEELMEENAEEEGSSVLRLGDDHSEVTIDALVNKMSVTNVSKKLRPAMVKIMGMNSIKNSSKKKTEEMAMFHFTHSWSKVDKETSTDDLNFPVHQTTHGVGSAAHSNPKTHPDSIPRTSPTAAARALNKSFPSFNCSPERMESSSLFEDESLDASNVSNHIFSEGVKVSSEDAPAPPIGLALSDSTLGENTNLALVAPIEDEINPDEAEPISGNLVDVEQQERANNTSPVHPVSDVTAELGGGEHKRRELKLREGRKERQVPSHNHNVSSTGTRPKTPLDGLLMTRPYSGGNAADGTAFPKSTTDIHEELKTSPNPLLVIYNEYRDSIPDVVRTRLLCAFFGEDMKSKFPRMESTKQHHGNVTDHSGVQGIHSSIAPVEGLTNWPSGSKLLEGSKYENSTVSDKSAKKVAVLNRRKEKQHRDYEHPDETVQVQSQDAATLPSTASGQPNDRNHSPHRQDVLSETQRNSSVKCLQLYFKECIPALTTLIDSSSKNLNEVCSCEQMLKVLLTLVNDESTPSAIFDKSLETLYRKMGEIKAAKFTVEVQLAEYRAVFESLQTGQGHALQSLLRTCEEYGKSLKLFYICQGKLVEITQRLAVVKDHVVKCKLPITGGLREQSSVLSQPGRSRVLSGESIEIKYDHNKGNLEEHSINTFQNQKIGTDEYSRLAEFASQVQKELADVKEELEEVNMELFTASMEKDSTPGAIKFFAVMHDPATIITLEQLYFQLSKLKGFADCSEHLDFATLRKRLKECISTVPILERFISRYQVLHKKWATHRYSLFTDRKQTGGNADGAFTCPICCTDVRPDKPVVAQVKPVRLHKGTMVGHEVRKDKPPTRRSRHAKEQIFGPTASASASVTMLPKLKSDISIGSYALSIDDNTSFGSPHSLKDDGFSNNSNHRKSLPRLER